MNTAKERLKIDTIQKLTLLDASSYRCIRIAHNNKSLREAMVSIKESREFRSNLHSIYNSLSLTELQDLYRLRKGDY
jgi:hypothetical protein